MLFLKSGNCIYCGQPEDIRVQRTLFWRFTIKKIGNNLGVLWSLRKQVDLMKTSTGSSIADQ